MLPALDTIVRAYRDHREDRLGQIRSALEDLGAGAEVTEVADAVYAAVDPAVRPAAELSVAAQLHYLRAGQRHRLAVRRRYAWSHAYRPVCSRF